MEKDVQSQIKELEGKIKELRSFQIAEIEAKLKEARELVADLENQLAQITGRASTATARRKRTSSSEVRSRILKALADVPTGLSQKEIADQTSLNYNTVVLYLKNHSKNLKSTGTLRTKRYFLK